MTVPEPTATSEGAPSPARQRKPENNELIVSYMLLRKMVGWIGTLLPIVLIAGNAMLFSAPRPYSMSGYYYTPMRDVFVGALCALGVFLLAYEGYDDMDRWITNVAGLGVIGVALFPTKPPVCPGAQLTPPCPPHSVRLLSAGQQIAGDIHLFFAVVAFVALGFMALRFAKSAQTPGGQPVAARVRHELGFARPRDDRRSQRKKWRQAVYRTCGFVIFACVLLGVLANLLPRGMRGGWPLLFIFEALAVLAFGISWFVKGQTLLPVLKDQPRPARGNPPRAGSLPGTPLAR